MLGVIMLSVIMLDVIMLSVIMLSVVVPIRVESCQETLKGITINLPVLTKRLFSRGQSYKTLLSKIKVS